MNAPGSVPAQLHAPLILTAAFDKPSFERFQTLRRAHFPPERNIVPAHLTLFHALPASEAASVANRCRLVTRGEPPIETRVTGLFNLGKGVAYRIEAPALARLRAELADAWTPLLTQQDRAGFHPHVTIMNKAEPDAAKALLAQMQPGFTPWSFNLIGLDLWRYLGGPWEAAGAFRFRS